MKYGSEDFAQLKETVGEFFRNGVFGDIRIYWEIIYPYKGREINYLDELAKADVRKVLINFLYDKSHGKRRDVIEKTEALIREIWDFGQPDKEQERDVLQALAWDTAMLFKQNYCWAYEQTREIGESDTDMVRKTYGMVRTLEGREELSDRLEEYMEDESLPMKLRVESEELQMRLINCPSPDRKPDLSIKNSYELQFYVQWIQELSAAYYTLPAKAYLYLKQHQVLQDYIVPKFQEYRSMACHEVVSDIMEYIKSRKEVYKSMMEVMGKEHLESGERLSVPDWNYIRDVEPACIEAIALGKGLYLGEALDVFYDSCLALQLEQGKERHSIMSIRQLTDYLNETEPELFNKYRSQPTVQAYGLEKPVLPR